MDIGQPGDFIKAGDLYLDYLKKKGDSSLAKGDNIVGTALIDPSAKISPSAKIGPNVIIGKDCIVEDGARLKNVCLMEKTKIGKHSLVINSLIGWGCTIGSWCRLESLCVFGEDVTVKDELHINGAIVCPHKSIGDNERTQGKILL